jgi:hypothetical protein
VLAALIAQLLGAPDALALAIGVIAALVAVIGFAALVARARARVWHRVRPHFPS